MAMIRLVVFPVEQILPNIGERQWLEYEGNLVKLQSLRLQTFKHKSIDCVVCGTQGAFFSVERQEWLRKDTVPHRGSYHMNLYGVTANGEVRLMTRDHIYPTASGGLDTLKNSITMCDKCNNGKGHKMPTEEFIAKHGGETGPYREPNSSTYVGQPPSPKELARRKAMSIRDKNKNKQQIMAAQTNLSAEAMTQ